MAWTAPVTWVAQALTAALLNQQLRDNLNETAPGKATTAGTFFVATGANAIAERSPTRTIVDTKETTTSGTFTDLATAGPAVTVTTGTAVLVIVTARLFNNTDTGQSVMSYAISGATTVAATNNFSIAFTANAADAFIQVSGVWVHAGLTAGTNIFTAKYAATNTGSFEFRQVAVIPF